MMDSSVDDGSERPRLVLFLEYDGTRYHGSQLQGGDTPTVQAAVEGAIARLTGTSRRVAMASRTDTGVHARTQVISFTPITEMAIEKYQPGMNHLLPNDISVTAAYWAPRWLDVRRSAVSRTYRYTIMNRRSRSALMRNRAAHVTEPLDAEAMAEAILALNGLLDVRPFCGPLSDDRYPMRRFDRARVDRQGEVVSIEVEANGFLTHQVRRTAGALVRVGTSQLSVDEFQQLAQHGRPGAATWIMPPQGLCLFDVRYDGFPDITENGDLEW